MGHRDVIHWFLAMFSKSSASLASHIYKLGFSNTETHTSNEQNTQVLPTSFGE